MAERGLETRYRLLAADFADGPRGALWRDRLGEELRPALDLLIVGLGKDLAVAPDELDRDRVVELLATLLPGRLGGRESWARSVPDLLEDLLLQVAEAEGLLPRQWEWVTAVGEGRSAFDAALDDPDRPRFADPKREPDRRPAPKIGRNDPCPCGSGRKYKACCLRLL